MNFLTTLAAGTLIAVGVPAVPPAATFASAITLDHHGKKADIIDTAVAADDFNTLAAALTAAELIEVLKGDGPFTVFAPTDAAFAKIDQTALENTLKPANRGRLTDVLTYHVVAGKLTAADLADRREVTTIQGQRLLISLEGGAKINNSRIVAADVPASNGVIHVIDTVLTPAKDDIVTIASGAGVFNTLIAALTEAELASVFVDSGKAGDTTAFTVFAPTDEAFAKLGQDTINDLLKPESRSTLVDILTYHVVPGRVYANDLIAGAKGETLQGSKIGATINAGNVVIDGQANVAKADIDASNGVIHIIDTVLIPGQNAGQVDPNAKAFMMVTAAIDKGAPAYNSGHHKQCADTYEAALMTLASNPTSRMCKGTMSTIKAALRDGKHQNAQDRAWTYRSALDKTMAVLMPESGA
ncbi:MAG: fasciclin domain-containing protein [Planctomycetota bacterium]